VVPNHLMAFPSNIKAKVGLYESILRISTGKGKGEVPPMLTPALISYSHPCKAAFINVWF